VFGIGGSEILVILIIALLFLGPDKLPDAAKQISKGIRDLKKHSRILTQTIENDETIGGALRDIKSALRGDEIAPRPVKKPVLQNKIEGEKVAELAVDRMRAVQESLARAASERPDFWSVVGQIELRVLVAVASKCLAAGVGELVADFRDLKARVPARSMWDSVNSEARFTLEPYEASAAPAEQAAAKALLDALAALAAD